MSRSLFQSTLPGWGATDRGQAGDDRNGISIHAPRMGSDPRAHVQRVRSAISIHAPRMGSDWRCRAGSCPTSYFNPRSPDGERRRHMAANQQSLYFNPRSPDGERHLRVLRVFHPCHFNPRSPDGERLGSAHVSIFPQIFQSTLPGWGATRPRGCIGADSPISIHAPRMGSDRAQSERHEPDSDFNPRSPDRERQI